MNVALFPFRRKGTFDSIDDTATTVGRSRQLLAERKLHGC
jgi:hypothetical protein